MAIPVVTDLSKLAPFFAARFKKDQGAVVSVSKSQRPRLGTRARPHFVI